VAHRAWTTISFVIPGGSERLDRQLCGYCGDVIGVYEPLILRLPSEDHRTSLLAEPDLFPTAHACYHELCYERGVAADRGE
jgi:hypothetical protein